ncbi:hypothetical protein KA005_56005, partial [bacterium]|nr:hypothetical protein [bacterium]
MAKVKGTDIYLKVNAGTEGAPNYQKVGGQKNASFDRALGTIDVTDKDSPGLEEHLPGIGNWSISFDAFLIEDNAYWLDIEDSHEARTQLLYQIITPSHTYTGKATVESLSMSGPLADAGVVSFTLKGTAALTKGP